MWQPGQSVRACPMWVSLINRVYRVLFLALYYHPPAVPCRGVPPTPLPHLLPPALPQDPVDAPGGCGKRKLRATRPSFSFPPSYSLARLSAPRLGSIFARRRAFTRDAFAVFCSGTRRAVTCISAIAAPRE